MKIYIEKYSLLIGVCAALLPVILFRDFTPSNELRYLSIADEAMRNHTFFAFTNHGVLYADLLLRQTTERAINSHIHAEPFYYYIVCIWYCLAPWSLLAIGTIIASIYQKPPHSSLQQFFLSVCLTTFFLLSCISSKLQIYLLPVIPFLIYSAIMVLPDFEKSRWMHTTLIIPAAKYSLTYPCLLIPAKTKSEELPFIGERLFAAAAVILTVTGIYSL